MTASRAPRHRPSPSPTHAVDLDAPARAVAVTPATAPAAPAAPLLSGAPTRPQRVLRSVVAALPSRAGSVRRLVAEELSYLRLPEELLDDAVVATDELFANAVRHGSTGPDDRVTVTVECTGHEVRVSVGDGSTDLPRRRSAGTGEESGRGLAIVAALTDDWGVAPPDPGETGKRVWFSLDIRDVP